MGCVRNARGVYGQRGAAMVEAAFVLIPLLALFLALVDFSFAIFLRSTFQHEVREGVRYAVTGRTASGMGQDASIKAVVQRNALGFLAGTSGASKIFIRYYDATTLAETNSNTGGNIVEISIEGYQWGWMAPLLRAATRLPIAARSSDRVEPSPGGMPPPR